MRCSKCHSNGAFEFSVREDMKILGLSVRAASHSIKCVVCGHVEVDAWSRQGFHLEVARAVVAAGIRSRRAFEYVARVLGLPETELGVALGVSAATVRRWLEGVDPIPVGAMQALARLLGPSAPPESDPPLAALDSAPGCN